MPNASSLSKDAFARRKYTVDKVVTQIVAPVDLGILSSSLGMLEGHNTTMFPKDAETSIPQTQSYSPNLALRQSNPNKPWLFRFTIHKSKEIYIYADLGGSNVVPIYEDTAAMLYVYGVDEYDESGIRQYIIDTVGERLQYEGVDVRTGFLSPEHIARRESRSNTTCQHRDACPYDKVHSS